MYFMTCEAADLGLLLMVNILGSILDWLWFGWLPARCVRLFVIFAAGFPM